MKIQRLTHKSIRPYGYLIDRTCVDDNGRENRFGILLKERSKGWRIGYLVVRERIIKKLESHPGSLETFEPVKGRAMIALSENKDPQDPKIFLLDRPVILKKGVWHNVAAIFGVCEMKIFENIEVATKYHSLDYPIKAPRSI